MAAAGNKQTNKQTNKQLVTNKTATLFSPGIVSLTRGSVNQWPLGPNASGNVLDNPRTIRSKTYHRLGLQSLVLG